MSKLQVTLESLQPYVIGIRYISKGVPVIDVILNDGWTSLNDPIIKSAKSKNDEGLNYYLVYSEAPTTTLDNLLDYVDRMIRANIDREKKLELLKNRINELKEVFKNNTLNKLEKLKFSFGEDEVFTTSLSDIDISLENEVTTHQQVTPISASVNTETTYTEYTNEKVELTNEELEILEEEARGERNRKILEEKRKSGNVNQFSKKIELPPRAKPKMDLVTTYSDYDTNCNCPDDVFCDKCIERKGL